MLYFRIHGDARYYVYFNDKDIFMYIMPSYSDTFVVVNLTDPDDYILVICSTEKFFKFTKLKEFNIPDMHAMYIDPKIFSKHPMFNNTEFKNILCLYYINLKNYVFKQTLNISSLEEWNSDSTIEEIVKNDGSLGKLLRMFTRLFQGYSVYSYDYYFPLVRAMTYDENKNNTEKLSKKERVRYGNKSPMEMIEFI